MKSVTLIKGDGIGPEVVDSALRVLEVAGAEIAWEEHLAGLSALDAGEEILPESTLESFRRTRAALKGPLTTPVGEGFRSVNVTLRKEFDLFANVRPSKTLVPGGRYEDVDLVMVRENTEGLYAGIEHYVDRRHNYAESITIVSREASERVIAYAFDIARSRARRRLTLVHKANILKYSQGLFLDTGRMVARDYAGEIEFYNTSGKRKKHPSSNGASSAAVEAALAGDWDAARDVQLDLPGGNRLHVINVHLKSKIPTDIPGQKIDGYTWRSADAWAEGSFISSMKRMSQALEVRRLIDRILDTDPAQIVVAGDFNNDGKLDLAVSNRTSGTVSLLAGNGDGTFGTALSISTTVPALSMTSGDFQADGHLDLVTSGGGSSLVFVYPGFGDGTFQFPIEIEVGTGMSRIAVGDFNRDTIKDLAIAGDNSQVYTLLGVGNGTFLQQPTIVLTADTLFVDGTDVDVADLNRDTIQDLVVAIPGNGSRTAILLGNGDGTFQQPAILTEPNLFVPQYQTIADFNRDGFPDIAIALAAAGTADAEALIPYCADQGLRYTAYSPLAGGWLSGHLIKSGWRIATARRCTSTTVRRSANASTRSAGRSSIIPPRSATA